MKQIITSQQKTYDVEFAHAPTFDGSCMIRLRDGRRLSEIAAEFDGLEAIHYVDSDTGEFDFDGYTALDSISRTPQGVTVKLVKEEFANEVG